MEPHDRDLHPDRGAAESEQALATLVRLADSALAGPDALADALASLLSSLLRRLPGDTPWRFWSVDDIVLDVVRREHHIVTLEGRPWWLAGGEDCDALRVTVELSTDPVRVVVELGRQSPAMPLLVLERGTDRVWRWSD